MQGLLFLSFTCTTLTAEEFSQAYLVISGPGSGLGALGHTYLLFTKKPGDLYGGVAYQYNLVLNLEDSGSKKKSALSKLLAIHKSPFLLIQTPAGKLIDHYQSQERVQYAFELALYPSELVQLIENLERDRAKRAESLPNDYSIIAKNCHTKIIDQINGVVSKDRQIPTIWLEKIDWLKILNRDLAGADVPLLAVNSLPKYQITSKPNVTLRAAAYLQYEKNRFYSKVINEISAICPWPMATAESLREMLLNLQVRTSIVFWQYFLEQKAVCINDLTPDRVALVNTAVRRIFSVAMVEAQDGSDLQNFLIDHAR